MTQELIDYIEFPAKDLMQTKAFFSRVFDWQFEDFGPDYCAFSSGHISGGFYRSELSATSTKGSALVVFFSTDLEASLAKIKAAGGLIVKDIFAFPGGRRFQFTEPSGNEFGVWAK